MKGPQGGALLYKTLLSTPPPPPQCGGYCLAKLMTGVRFKNLKDSPELLESCLVHVTYILTTKKCQKTKEMG